MARREGHDFLAEAHQVLRLAGEDDGAVPVIAVVQRADADGIPGGQEASGASVVEDQGKFRVQHGEHVCAVFLVEGQQDLAVAAAVKDIAFVLQSFFHRAEAVQLPVADHGIPMQGEGLHPFPGKAHDGKPLEAQKAVPGVYDPRIVRPTGDGTGQALLKSFSVCAVRTVSHDRTHNITLLIS